MVVNAIKVGKSYGQKVIFKDAEIEVERGQKIALVTPSSITSNAETDKNQIKQKVAETEDKVRGAIANIKNTTSNIQNSL